MRGSAESDKGDRIMGKRSEWFGTKPKKKDWLDHRNDARLTHCEVCRVRVLNAAERRNEEDYGDFFFIVRYEGVIDHLVAERLILKLAPQKAPHFAGNLMCLCKRCHGIKTSADRLLCKGDKLRFLEILTKNNWPMPRVQKALDFYGI